MTLIGNGNIQTTATTDNGSFGGLASLPSLGGDPLSRPSWKRSLGELAASNIALIGNNSNNRNNSNTNGSGGRHHAAAAMAASNAPPTSAAQMLLGSRTDFGSLISSSKSSTASSSSGGKFENCQNHVKDNNNLDRFSYDAMNGGGIEVVVRRHRDGMLERILKDQREETQRLLDKAVERQIEDDWKEERSWWRKELVGDRNLVDATNNNTHNNLGLGGGGESNFPSSSSSGGRGLLTSDYGSGDGNNNNTSGSSFATGCDPKTMGNHLDIVKGIQPTSDLKQVIADFERLARTSNNGYHSAWLLLGCMLPNTQSPINGAQGALSHFCRQYQRIINNHVKSASLSGQDTSTSINYGGSSTMAETIAAYVKLTSGSNASVWEILYLCKCTRTHVCDNESVYL